MTQKRWTVDVLMLYSQADESWGNPDEHEYATPESYRATGGYAFIGKKDLCIANTFETKKDAEHMLKHLYNVEMHEEDPTKDELAEFPDNCEMFICTQCVEEVEVSY